MDCWDYILFLISLKKNSILVMYLFCINKQFSSLMFNTSRNQLFYWFISLSISQFALCLSFKKCSQSYWLLTERLGVARGKKIFLKKIYIWKKIIIFLDHVTPRLPMSYHKKNFSPFGPAVWPARGTYIWILVFMK